MAWVPLAIGAVGAIGGMISGNRAAADAERAAEMQNALGQAQLGFQQKVYGDQKALQDEALGYYRPYLKDPNLFYTEYKDQLEKNQAQGFRQSEEAAMRSGTLGTDFGANYERSAALKKASDLSKGWLAGKMARLDLAKGLLSAGNPLAASGQMSGAYSSMMNALGGQASMFNNNAMAGYNSAGAAMQGGLSAYGYMQGQQAPPKVPTDGR